MTQQAIPSSLTSIPSEICASLLELSERELARRDSWFFLTHAVYTLDQHDGENPIKGFSTKPYLKYIQDQWHKESRLVVPKSRQMIMTWLFVALNLWFGMYSRGKLIFFQSKKEDDAIGDENAGTGLLGRAKFIYNHLPDHYKVPCEMVYNKIKFPETNSTIWAVPQGGDIIRQHTASSILSDEMAFQPEAEHAYTGALPTIKGGGRFTGISSANPGFFHYLVSNQ